MEILKSAVMVLFFLYRLKKNRLSFGRKLSVLTLFFMICAQSAIIAQSTLCPSNGQNQTYEWVTRIKIHDGERTSGKTGYADFTTTPISTLIAGKSYDIEVDVNTNNLDWHEYVKLWFDLNQDNIIQDPEELVYIQNATVNPFLTFKGTFTIPTTAYNGIMIGRMIMQYAQQPALCGSYTYGTTYDIKADILGGTTNPINRTLSVSRSGGTSNKIISTPSGINTENDIYVYDFKENTSVTLTAIPSSEEIFINWSGDASGENQNLTVIMDADKHIMASFGLKTLPSVTSSVVSSISETTASPGGIVVSDGNAFVDYRGVVWNTTGSPTIADNKTIDGSGTGSFNSLLTSLHSNTTYYVRSYAINSVGITYGSQISFKTLPSAPTSISASKKLLCKGTPTNLVADGIQGTVYWYAESCGGALLGIGNAITVTPETTKTFFARNFNGVFSDGCAAVTITVSDYPPVPVLSPAGTAGLCPGGNVTLSAPPGYLYLWSNGATVQSININEPGNYRVTISNASGCSTTSEYTTVTINPVLQIPSISPAGPITLCQGENLTLTAPIGYLYLWNNGATTQSISVSEQGDYRVTIRNTSGCSATSASAIVRVKALPVNPKIGYTNPLTFCYGGFVRLTAPEGYTYHWSNGKTSQSIIAKLSGDYFVEISNGTNCSVFTDTVEIKTLLSGVSGPTAVCENNTVELFASSGFNSYQWFKDGISIPGPAGTANTLITGDEGNYTVLGSSQFGDCLSPIFQLSKIKAPVLESLETKAVKIDETHYEYCGEASFKVKANYFSSLPHPEDPLSFDITYADGTKEEVKGNNVLKLSKSADVQLNLASVGCKSRFNFHVSIGEIPTKPSIQANGPTSFCQGGSVTLTASEGTKYLWSTGAETRSITVSSAGEYNVTVRNNTGCSVASDNTIVMITSSASNE